MENNQAAPASTATRALGGGIYVSTGTVEITNSTLANDSATENPMLDSIGGAIFSFGGPVDITNSTIVGNTADFGAGIGTGTYNLKGLILADNLPGTAGGNCFPAVNDLNYNISDDGSCSFVQPKSVNNATAAQLALDPMGLKNNGGPTATIRLEAGTIAVHRIPAADCKAPHITPQPLEVAH